MSSDNILISGATGFIGRSYLKHKNKSKLFSITNKRKAVTDINISSSATVKDINYFINKNKIDSIIHLATKFVRNDDNQLLNTLVDANYALPTKLLSATENTSVKRFVYIGTSWEKLDNNPKVAKNLYASVKKSFDAIADYWAFKSNVQITKLTLCDTYGPFDDRNKIVDLIIKSIERPFKINSPTQFINLTYSADICSALDCILESDLPGNIVREYMVRSNNEISLKELVYLVENILNKKLMIEFGASASVDQFLPYTRLPSVPGWHQKYTLEEGLVEKMRLEGFLDD